MFFRKPQTLDFSVFGAFLVTNLLLVQPEIVIFKHMKKSLQKFNSFLQLLDSLVIIHPVSHIL